jgi:hypothetical protein
MCPLGTLTCLDCLRASCESEIVACRGNDDCEGALGSHRECACAAQDGTGTVDDCNAALTDAGGQTATALLGCINAGCSAECGI